MNDANLNEYCKTKDLKLREKLIIEYMPVAKKIVLDLGITDIDEEDLVQIAYEALILAIDKFKGNYIFYTFLKSRIIARVEMFRKHYRSTDVSLNEIDVYSNENFEERITYETYVKLLLTYIKKELSNSVSERDINVFNKVYDANHKSLETVGKEFKLSFTRIIQIRDRVLKKIKRHALFSRSNELSDIVNISIYRDCDNIEDSHSYIKK